MKLIIGQFQVQNNIVFNKIKKKIMKENSELLQLAIELATSKHKGQVRKNDGRPYILHPFSVLNLLYKYKRKSSNIFLLAIVIILHDAVEDTDLTLEEIAQLFGYKVASIVDELTSNKEEIERVGKTTYLSNKMNNMSTYGLLCKLLDRLDNISDLHGMSEDFITKTINDTKYIIDNLNRKLTKTHLKIIKDIYIIINKYSNT